MKRTALPLIITVLCNSNLVVANAAETVAGVTLTVPTTRDALKQPFASSSIWNTPIGSGAAYVPIKLPAVPRGDVWALMPQIDDEIIVLTPTAPVTTVATNNAGWTGTDRCPNGGTPLQWAPIPSDFTVPNSKNNNSAVFLATDRRTLIHVQPFTRCVAGTPASAMVQFPTVDLYGDGRAGSHGGSRLSAIGGSLRVGELRPGGQPPRHALKINLDAHVVLAKCATRDSCWRWPAYTADSYAANANGYGSIAGVAGSIPIPAGMKMGALLAIPASVDLSKLGLETKPGQMLAWTFQNYGAYVVDDTWGAAFAINAENGPGGSFRTQFKNDWGYALEARVRDNTPWVRDMQKIVTNLALVNNNSSTTVGGGGTPRQPKAPELVVPK